MEASKLPGIIQRIWRVTFVILLTFVAFVFLPWQQTVTGDGEVQAYVPGNRAYTVTAPIDGVVTRFYVQDFDRVKKGDPLFEMRDFDPNFREHLQKIDDELQKQRDDLALQLGKIDEQLETTRKLYEQKIRSIRLKKRSLQAKLEAAKLLKTSAESAMETLRRRYERSKNLFGFGIVSKQQLEEHRTAYEAAKAKCAEAEAKIVAFEQDLQLLQQRVAVLRAEREFKLLALQKERVGVKNRMQSVSRQIERNAIEQSRYNARVVRAKSDGHVLKILQNDTNKAIKRYEPVLEFAPDVSKRAIWVRIHKLQMPLVKKGLKARIVFYGWPTIYIPGWPAIQHGTYGGVVEKVEYSSKDAYFRVLVVQDPDDEPWPSSKLLRPGTHASVWINLEVVPMWYEIWRVMAAQPPVMLHHE